MGPGQGDVCTDLEPRTIEGKNLCILILRWSSEDGEWYAECQIQ